MGVPKEIVAHYLRDALLATQDQERPAAGLHVDTLAVLKVLAWLHVYCDLRPSDGTRLWDPLHKVIFAQTVESFEGKAYLLVVRAPGLSLSVSAFQSRDGGCRLHPRLVPYALVLRLSDYVAEVRQAFTGLGAELPDVGFFVERTGSQIWSGIRRRIIVST